MDGVVRNEYPKPRRKAFSQRSRRGCRTCRIRRVKCDETPGACVKCTSTGRECDGYDTVRLPPKRGFGATLFHQTRIFLPDKTSDERRSFSFFQSLTSPMMNGLFDHLLWSRVVLQYSQGEPAICHAVIAVSTLHEASEAAGEPVLLEDTNNRQHRFALSQYNRSIAYLNSRMSSNDPNIINIVLICCLLYITFELIGGKYDRAHAHLRKGVQLLYGRQDSNTARELFQDAVDSSLARAMMHLDVQGMQWGVSSLLEGLGMDDLEHLTRPKQRSVEIRSLAHGVEVRDHLMGEVCIFGWFAETLYNEDLPTNTAPLLQAQRLLQSRMAEFGQALEKLAEARLSDESTTAKEKRGWDLLRIHYLGISLRLDTSLIKSKDVMRARFAARFTDRLEQVKRVMDWFCGEEFSSAVHRPTLLMETGVIVPLFFICEQCGDPELSRQALSLLESWPHREGLWDTRVAAMMIRSKGAFNGHQK